MELDRVNLTMIIAGQDTSGGQEKLLQTLNEHPK